MIGLTATDTMLVADALIEYAVRNIRDEALFARAVEVLRTIGSPAAADCLVRYRDSVRELTPESFDANLVRLYAPDTDPYPTTA